MIIKNELKNYIWPLKDEEKIELEKSILKEGCRDALIYAEIDGEEVLLDGHNRLEICEKHGIEYKTILNKDVHTIEQAKDWIDSNQIARRNLTMDQFKISIGRRYLAEKKSVGEHKGNQYTMESGQNAHIPKTDEKLSEEYNVDPKTIRRYAQQAQQYEQLEKEAPEIAEKVRTGEATIKDILNEKKKAERIKEIEEIKQKIETEIIEQPEGLFDVIVVDPPWDYDREYDPEGSRIASPYPEMSLDELKELKLPAKDDSVLFLWTTQKFIWDAKELLDFWGYIYKAIITWDKEKMGMGAWFRMQCEFCLVGIKGHPIWNNTSYRDIIRESRREHSRKPDIFYEMVNNITVGRKLDYFSRENREGWISWGAENGKLG